MDQVSKRKWQLALRRYILEGARSFDYARYFGISSARFRVWIEQQFEPTMHWDNYSTVWQLDHIVPVSCFDLNNEQDLRLAWSFLNIKPELIGLSQASKMDIISAQNYFECLYTQTGLKLCADMLKKIDTVKNGRHLETKGTLTLLDQWKKELELVDGFDNYDFDKWNLGIAVEKIIAEKELLKKRGL